MSRRPQGVFRDANGRWGFVFSSTHRTPEGKRRQVRRRGFATMGEAKDALDQARREDTPGTAGTVGDVLDQYVRTKRLAGRAPKTIEQYEWAAGLARARWGTWSAERLTADDLDGAYLEMLSGGSRVYRRGKGTRATGRPMSPRSVEVLHAVVKAAFRLAIDRGELVRNPAALATPPAPVEQRRSWWTPEQVGQFLTYVAERSDLPAGLVDLLADTGGRRGEVLGVCWGDVDLHAGTVTITRQLAENPGGRLSIGRRSGRGRRRPSACTPARSWRCDVAGPSRVSTG